MSADLSMSFRVFLDAAVLTVYVLHEDNTESMLFDSQEIMDYFGIFGVDREK